MQHEQVLITFIKQRTFIYYTEVLHKLNKIDPLSEKVRLTHRKSMNHEAAATHNEE